MLTAAPPLPPSPLLCAGEGLEFTEGCSFDQPVVPELSGAAVGGGGGKTNVGGWFVPLAVGYVAVAALAVAKSIGRAAGGGD